MIFVVNKKRKRRKYPQRLSGAIILDITSKSSYAQKLSPFYPHGNIPIPFSNGATSMSVEGIWQGLKVFEHEDVCMDSFANDTMKNFETYSQTTGLP